MTKETNELRIRDDGLYYTKGAKKPFTGLHKMYHDNGQLRLEAPFKKGEKDGLEKQWYDSGEKLLEVLYKSNKAEGLYTHYHKNGQKHVEGMYQDGEQEGLWSYYDENGEKISEYDVFERGELVERDGSKISYFSNLINSYKETYNLKVQNFYEHFLYELSYDTVAEAISSTASSESPPNTIIVDTGDVSYLVLRPNKDPIKLDPFFELSEESVDSSYSISIDGISIGQFSVPLLVAGEAILVRYLPGIDDYDYPSIENQLPLNSGYETTYNSFETLFTKVQSAFKDLDLDAEQNYILGRKLVVSMLSHSTILAKILDNEAILLEMQSSGGFGEVVKKLTNQASEEINDIYGWAGGEGRLYNYLWKKKNF